MSSLLLTHAHLYADGKQELTDASIYCVDGKIIEVSESDLSGKYPDAIMIDLNGKNLLPGFIDTHIHGAMGRDAIDGKQETIDAMAYNVVKDGCTAFLASLTVISHAEMLSVLKSFSTVTQPENGATFLGIHEEGPYLSKEYKALMDETYLRNPSAMELEEMIEASGKRIVSMTVAPELSGMDSFIPYAVDQHITVMIGHSAATAKQAIKAIDLGASGYTHLYNACSQHLHRDPGVVTGAYLSAPSYCELMCDGYHVDEDIVRFSYEYLTAKRIVLITDAMLGKGMPDGEFIFSKLLCQKEGQHVYVKATGRRAGSAFGMIDAVRYLRNLTGCSYHEIVQMACVNPAVLAKVNDRKGRLLAGMDADMVVLDDAMNVVMTIVNGTIVYQ